MCLLIIGCLFLSTPFIIIALIMMNAGFVGVFIYILYMFATFCSIVLPAFGFLLIKAKKYDSEN